MEVTITICDLCYLDGEKKDATASYMADDQSSYDVCKKHADEARRAGFSTWRIKGEQDER